MSDAFVAAAWLICGSVLFFVATLVFVVVGLMWSREEDRVGTGRRCGGGRRSRCGQGCTKPQAADGPAACDLATLARAGWVDVDMVRRMEGK